MSGVPYPTGENSFDLRAAFAQDATRFERFSQSIPIGNHSIFCDLSKNFIDATIESSLLERAAKAGVEAKRDAMFRGESINTTEGRAVGHVRLRDVDANGQSQDSEVRPALEAFLAYADTIRQHLSPSGVPVITDIVNIGIGGSDLGPAFAVRALDQFVDQRRRYHFVSNVDGHELSCVLRQIQPASTLFVIASKTFTTAETMQNAASAIAWFLRHGGTQDGSSQLDVSKHFCAVTANVAAAQAFGLKTIFPFWQWVGGRYSLWSAIGLPLAIAIGSAAFRRFLRGAHQLDQHFKTAPLAHNLPVRLGALDVHYRNHWGFSTRCMAPYAFALATLPAYLQQLEMESNGKSVDMSGASLSVATAPVVWGEAGTNGQHAFFQMLHQGASVIPVEFVAVAAPPYDAQHLGHSLQTQHHRALLSHALAQSQALMQGRDDANAHKRLQGNRPSTFLLLDALTPETLGALIALYEHRVFVSGVLWGINSFDQFGVELGKQLAQDIEPRLSSAHLTGLDASTAGLLTRLLGQAGRGFPAI